MDNLLRDIEDERNKLCKAIREAGNDLQSFEVKEINARLDQLICVYMKSKYGVKSSILNI